MYINYKDVDFKPSKNYDENVFKVYRYIHLNDIQILLTPKNRMNTVVILPFCNIFVNYTLKL